MRGVLIVSILAVAMTSLARQCKLLRYRGRRLLLLRHGRAAQDTSRGCYEESSHPGAWRFCPAAPEGSGLIRDGVVDPNPLPDVPTVFAQQLSRFMDIALPSAVLVDVRGRRRLLRIEPAP
jgi:hypothetical protein